MGRLLTAALVGILSSVIAIGCTKKGGKLDYGLNPSETLRINIQQEPPSLDWSKSVDTTSSLVESNIMNGLVEFNLSDPELSLDPALATSWSSTRDAKTWTFNLRQDVKWTDGVAFTGQHVIDGWERLLNPSTASQYAYFLFGVKNAQKYSQGKIKDFNEVGVRLDGEGRLIVELEQGKSYFPYLLDHHSTFPIRKDVIEKHGDRWTDPANIVTLGAYKLKIWEHDKALVMERNDQYYGSKAKIPYIYAYMINEMSTAINLFDAGKLDLQYELPSREIRNLRTRTEYRQKGNLGLYYYGFNIKKPPFDNLKVRKAFVKAIDRKQITDMLAGGYTPLSGWIPSGMFGYEPERGIQFDLEGARKLLDEAGFKDRSKFPRVKLAFNTLEDHQRIAENVQAQLKKNLGVTVEVVNEEWKVYLAHLHSDAPSMYRMGWIADYPDPDNFINLMASYSENNHTGWKSAAYDDLIAKGVSETNKEKRRAIYSEAQRLLTEVDVPVLPIYSYVTQALVHPRVKSFELNALKKYVFRGVELQ
jgi:oligopeptide transport system substrate-binding protein